MGFLFCIFFVRVSDTSVGILDEGSFMGSKESGNAVTSFMIGILLLGSVHLKQFMLVSCSS